MESLALKTIIESINPTTCLQRFVFRFMSVGGKWVYQGRRWVLKRYTKAPYGQLLI